jgi:hypothetical protein
MEGNKLHRFLHGRCIYTDGCPTADNRGGIANNGGTKRSTKSSFGGIWCDDRSFFSAAPRPLNRASRPRKSPRDIKSASYVMGADHQDGGMRAGKFVVQARKFETDCDHLLRVFETRIGVSLVVLGTPRRDEAGVKAFSSEQFPSLASEAWRGTCRLRGVLSVTLAVRDAGEASCHAPLSTRPRLYWLRFLAWRCALNFATGRFAAYCFSDS